MTNAAETQVSKATINQRIAELKAEIEASPFTLEESRAAQERVHRFYSDIKSATKEEADVVLALTEQIIHAQAVDEIERLEVTRAADLMHCPKRYVVTDTPSVTSPAGFAPASRVYIQTAIAIHTDTLDDLPSCNVPLYAHDLSRMVA
jgi:hypothetical protein